KVALDVATEELGAAEARRAAAIEQRGDAEWRRAEHSRVVDESVHELRDITLLPGDPLQAVAGDVASLREAHRDALNLYNAAVGAHEITRKIADAQHEAAEHRNTLRQQRGEALTEAEVEAALAQLADPSEALQRQAAAEARRTALWPKVGSVSSTLTLRQNQLKEVEATWEAVGGLALAALPVPTSDADAIARIRAARGVEQRSTAAKSDAEQLIQTATELAREEQERASRARSSREALDPTLGGLERLGEVLGSR